MLFLLSFKKTWDSYLSSSPVDWKFPPASLVMILCPMTGDHKTPDMYFVKPFDLGYLSN